MMKTADEWVETTPQRLQDMRITAVQGTTHWSTDEIRGLLAMVARLESEAAAANAKVADLERRLEECRTALSVARGLVKLGINNWSPELAESFKKACARWEKEGA